MQDKTQETSYLRLLKEAAVAGPGKPTSDSPLSSILQKLEGKRCSKKKWQRATGSGGFYLDRRKAQGGLIADRANASTDTVVTTKTAVDEVLADTRRRTAIFTALISNTKL